MEPNGLKLRKGDFEGLALGLRAKPKGESVGQPD